MPWLCIAYDLNYHNVWVKGIATIVLNHIPNYESCKPASPPVEISTLDSNIRASLWTQFNYQHLKNILSLIKQNLFIDVPTDISTPSSKTPKPLAMRVSIF